MSILREFKIENDLFSGQNAFSTSRGPRSWRPTSTARRRSRWRPTGAAARARRTERRATRRTDQKTRVSQSVQGLEPPLYLSKSTWNETIAIRLKATIIYFQIPTLTTTQRRRRWCQSWTRPSWGRSRTSHGKSCDFVRTNEDIQGARTESPPSAS